MIKSQGVATALVVLLGASAAPARADGDEPIQDNSFLIEEAYNQEPGVVQHVTTFLDLGESPEWSASFTQEWPLSSQRHQLSYTLLHVRLGDERGWGDVALHYRYQLLDGARGPVALAPRLSLLVPTGDTGDGLGTGSLGLQVNLPVSVELARRWAGHWNLGGSWVPDAEARDGARADLDSFQAGQGLVFLLRPKLNLLFEAVYTRARSVREGGGTERDDAFLVSPGLRFALDRPSGLQIVPGIAVPIGVGPSEGEWSVFAYLSLEHPF